MDSKTGQIYLEPTKEQMANPDMVEIPREDLETVINMNRRARRAWAAKKRRAVKRGSRG
jgi:hypothetical protein